MPLCLMPACLACDLSFSCLSGSLSFLRFVDVMWVATVVYGPHARYTKPILVGITSINPRESVAATRICRSSFLYRGDEQKFLVPLPASDVGPVRKAAYRSEEVVF
jgi:hypothetical protein